MEGNQTEPNLNPLLLPPVIARLFQYLPLGDLTSCRLVCKQWFNESLATWRSQNTLRFTHWSLRLTNRNESQGQTNVKEFLQFWEDNHGSSKPYRRISCTKCSSTDLPMFFDMEGFWECIGQPLTHMTLQQCDFQDVNEAHRIMYNDCPNLQSLTMNSCKIYNEGYYVDSHFLYYGDTREESYIPPKFGEQKNLKSLSLIDCLPDSWLGILSHFSSLEYLRPDNSYEDPNSTVKMLEAVKMIREEQGRERLQIKYFEESFRLKPDRYMLIFDLLLELNLPLDSLCISLNGDTDQNLVDNVLTNHCQTIRQIYSDDFVGKFEGCVSFPPEVELGNLQELEVCPGLFQNLEFLKHTPNLQSFHVFDYSGLRKLMALEIPPEPYYLFSNYSALNMGNGKLDALTKLYLDCLASTEQLQNFVPVTPNVSELTMFLDDRKLAIVCGNWKKLVKLVDYGWSITDWGIVGEDVKTGAIYPSITELKDLVSFTTRSDLVGEVGVFDGLLHLPQLREVVIKSTLEKIGQGADAALREKGIHVKYGND